MRRAALLRMVAGLVFAMATAGEAQPAPDAAIPAKASEQIVADLARADLNAFATDATKYMTLDASDRQRYTWRPQPQRVMMVLEVVIDRRNRPSVADDGSALVKGSSVGSVHHCSP